jgi:hypothetical protein
MNIAFDTHVSQYHYFAEMIKPRKQKGFQTLIRTSETYLEIIALSASRRMLSSKRTWLKIIEPKKDIG